MALGKPEKVPLSKHSVSGLTHHSYERCDTHIAPGTALGLLADPFNDHDAYAVKVLYAGIQIGWIPKNENRRISVLLQRGDQLEAVVLSHDRDRSIHHDRLQIEVNVVKATAKPSNGSLTKVDEFGMPTGSPQAYSRFKSLPVGTVLGCVSGPHRSSISLTADGEDLAWFRKARIPGDLVDMADAGRLRAQIVATDPPAIVLFDRAVAGPLPRPAPDEPDLCGPTETVTRVVEKDGTQYVQTRVVQQKPNLQQIPKETTMNISSIITKSIEANKTAASQAGYLEAGRIANNQLVKVASKSLPFMARGYADTALGRLLIANAAMVAAGQLRPNDATLGKLTQAMAVAAYQEVIQSIDIEGMINGLMSSPEIQSAIAKLPKDAE